VAATTSNGIHFEKGIGCSRSARSAAAPTTRCCRPSGVVPVNAKVNPASAAPGPKTPPVNIPVSGTVVPVRVPEKAEPPDEILSVALSFS
jgi:hypothetical protein